ncbi:hypothetical protein FO433_03950 [Weissella cibaria]|uniref:hypothetical protein n=1 Tax=Weissella cibaria TaxID=137591 RepID=UPI001196FB3C|nr:hypothetical protein [Weissella cibaria]TVV25004.1 hypothetical protein FO433_03950 [Weissella cibaria]
MFKKVNWQLILVVLIVPLVIMSPILFNGTALLGVDGYFHYNRIFEAAMQLRDRNLSFLNLYTFQQAGRIVNQVYSPLVTYFFGALLLVAGTWYKFQILTLYIVYALGILTMYFSATKVGLTKRWALSLGVVYTSSAAVYGFVFGATWKSIALAIVPLVIPSLVHLFEGRFNWRRTVYLGVVVALLAQFQVLTVAIVLPMLLPFFAHGVWVAQAKLRFLGRIVLAAMLAIVLSLNTIMPLAEVYRNTLISPVAMNMVPQTSPIFQPMYTGVNSNSDIVISVMAFLLLGMTIAFWKKLSVVTRFMAIVAIVYLVVGTSLVPWHLLETNYPGLRSFLQMPRRISLTGYALTIVVVGKVFMEVRPDNNVVRHLTPVILAVVSVLLLTQKVANNVYYVQNEKTPLYAGLQATPRNVYSPDIHTFVQLQPLFHDGDMGKLIYHVDRTTPDYVPVDSTTETHQPTYDAYMNSFSKQWRPYQHIVNGDGTMTLHWKSNVANKKRLIPVVAYERTKLVLNGRSLNVNRLKRNTVGALYVADRRGVNRLVLSYSPATITKLGMYLSIMGWGLTVAVITFIFLKKYDR